MPNHQVTCEEAREALWPNADGPALDKYRAHITDCTACQAFFATDQAVGSRLSHLARDRAPAGLRDRVLNAIDAEQNQVIAMPRRRARWIAGTLAAAAALALAVGLGRPPSDEALAAPFLAEAARTLSPASTFRSSDFAQVEAWLTTQIGTDVELPDITDAKLLGARVIAVDGRSSAAAVYDLHGMPMTYFVVPDTRIGGRVFAAGDLVSAERAGIGVTFWTEPGGVRAVAAPMPRAELRAVAVECREKALRSL